MPLIINPTQKDLAPPVFLLVSDPGAGKTSMCLTAPRPVFVAIDRTNVEKLLAEYDCSFSYWPVQTEAEAIQAIEALSKDPRFDTVIFDNLSKAWQDWGGELVEAAGADHKFDYDDWGVILRKFMWIQKYAMSSRKLFIWLGHTKEVTRSVGQGKAKVEITKVKLALVGDAVHQLPSQSTYVFYLEQYPEAGRTVRVVHTAPYKGMIPKGSNRLDRKERPDFRVILAKLGYKYPREAYALAESLQYYDFETGDNLELYAPEGDVEDAAAPAGADKDAPANGSNGAKAEAKPPVKAKVVRAIDVAGGKK